MSLGHNKYFREGLPTFQHDLSDIDPKYNNIIVLDDLMDLARSFQSCLRNEGTETQVLHCCCRMLFFKENTTPVPVVMEIYNEIKVKPYSYVLIDNKADIAVHRQIIIGVLCTCVSYALPSTSKAQTLKKRPAAQMNSKQGIVPNSATRVLQIDEKRGPLLVHRNQNQWSMVKDVFQEAER